MSQSLVRNCMHITFSTKARQPLLTDSIQANLYAYLAGICKKLQCTPIKIGGHVDHVHVLCFLSKNITLSKLLEELKSHSSKWIKTKDEKLKDFYWQGGYGAFGVDVRDIEKLISYIENQKEHHKKMTFQEELRKLLDRYNFTYDEHYIWD